MDVDDDEDEALQPGYKRKEQFNLQSKNLIPILMARFTQCKYA